MKGLPVYRVRCRDCGWEQERLEELATAEYVRANHQRVSPGHRVRLSFDLHDVLVDETTGASQELERR